MPEQPRDKEFEIPIRIVAIETVLNDMIATVCMATPDPLQAAKKTRERWKTIMTNPSYKRGPDTPGYSELLSGAVDDLMRGVEEIIQARLATLAQWQ